MAKPGSLPNRANRTYPRLVPDGPGGASLVTRAMTLMGTTTTNWMSPDGFTWAQGKPGLLDSFGKVLVWGQAEAGFLQPGGAKVHRPLATSDGVTWTEPTRTAFFSADGEGFTTRCSQAHDTKSDRIHSLWVGQDTTDGVFYRQYTLTRDASNNVTNLHRILSVQLDLQETIAKGWPIDDPGMTYSHPVCVWVPEGGAVHPNGGTYGSVVCLWGATAASHGAAVRGSMLALTGSSTSDSTAANWTGLRNEASIASTITQLPQVKVTEVAATASTGVDLYPSAGRLPATARTHANDLCVVWADATRVHARYLGWDGANKDWRGTLGAVQDGPLLVRPGATDAGYTLKPQLVTGLHYDATNDRVRIGYSCWLSDVLGDGWATTYLNNTTGAWSGVLVDHYAGGASNAAALQFVTGDLLWDDARGVSVVAYTTLLNHDVRIEVRDADGVLTQSPVAVLTVHPFDIPCLVALADGTVVCFGRVFNDAMRTRTVQISDLTPGDAYDGYAVRLTWA